MKRSITLYFPHLNIAGGVEMAMLMFCKRYKEKYNIIVNYSVDSDKNMVEALSKYAKVEKVGSIINADIFIDCTTYALCSHTVVSNKLYLWQHCMPNLFGDSIFNDKEFMKNVDGIIVVSKTLQKAIKEMGYDSTVIYNDFDIEDIRKKADAFKTIQYDYCYVGRISYEKNLDTLAKIARRYRNRYFAIVGNTDNSNEYLKYLLSYPNIDLIDATPNPYPYMKNSKFVVLPSKFETWGRVITESLIIGTPVITSNFESAYEQVIEGKNGYILDMQLKGLTECQPLKIKPLDFKSNWEEWERIIGD